jgi:hypothetical protein
VPVWAPVGKRAGTDRIRRTLTGTSFSISTQTGTSYLMGPVQVLGLPIRGTNRIRGVPVRVIG